MRGRFWHKRSFISALDLIFFFKNVQDLEYQNLIEQNCSNKQNYRILILRNVVICLL